LEHRVKRTLRAAILSPFAAVPVFIAWYLIFRFFLMQPGDMAESWAFLLIFLVYVLVIGLAASFFVGVPVDWLLRRIGIQSPVTYAMVGGALGAVIAVVLFPPSTFSLVFALCGAAVGASFRILADVDE
jgi:hypothetical protein